MQLRYHSDDVAGENVPAGAKGTIMLEKKNVANCFTNFSISSAAVFTPCRSISQSDIHFVLTLRSDSFNSSYMMTCRTCMISSNVVTTGTHADLDT